MDILSVGVILEGDLLTTALKTAIIETPLLFLVGYHGKRLLCWFFIVNIVSNILFNEMLMTNFTRNLYLDILLGECLVVALEFCMMLYAVRKEKRRLLAALLATNCVSLAVGLVYFMGGNIG